MNKKRFVRRWERQYCRGLKEVRKQLKRCRETGVAEAVHELRVAIRRTRLLALMGRPVIGRQRGLAFRAWAQRLADALSPVRDYDVMIEWANTACQDEEFIRGLRHDRAAAWREARKSLKTLPAAEWKELRCLRAGGKERRKLVARYARIAAATRQTIEADAVCFERLDPTGRHDLRRAVRRLKYLEELEHKPQHTEPLGKLQAGLGELQNAQAMKDLLKNGRKHTTRNRRMMRQVKRHESEWFPRCRRSIKGVINM